MSEIEKINNDLIVDDMVYRPTSALDKCERLEKQLSVAKEALAGIEKNGTDSAIQTITTLCVNNWLWAHKALKEIKELEK